MKETEPKIYETLKQQEERTPEEIKEGLKVDFERLLENLNSLEKQYSELKKELSLDEKGKTMVIPKEHEKKFQESWENVIKRIEKETDAFSDWEDTGVESGLILGLDEGNYVAPVEFRKKTLLTYLYSIIVRGNIGGRAELDAVKLYLKVPDFLKLWLAIIKAGPGSNILEALDHELIHVLQHTGEVHEILRQPDGFIEGLQTLEMMKNAENKAFQNRALNEMHAYKSSTAISSKRPLTSELIKHIKNGYKVKNIDQLTAAADLVDKLKALGLDDTEIGRLVEQAEWNKKDATWGALNREVGRLGSKYKLETEDVENLVLADRMERKIQSLKAQIIALEEMTKVAESFKDSAK